MTEDEMKKKNCPSLLQGVAVSSVLAVINGNSEEQITEMFNSAKCSAAECAMWEAWEYTQAILIGEDDELPEGWTVDEEYKVKEGSTTKRKRITRQQMVGEGDCGLKTKELECGCNG